MEDTLRTCYEALGFRQTPFSITPDTGLFFPGGRHVAAYKQLYHACMTGVISVLSGEIGLGKTLVLRCVLRTLPNSVRVAYLINPLMDLPDLLRTIGQDFGGPALPVGVPISVVHSQLVDTVLEGARDGTRFVVIVDEAHRLSSDALEALRLLSNLETERNKLIGLVLVGQPELERTLALRAMRPLRERVGVWLKLDPLSRSESSAYVRHRIKRTHRDGEFEFTSSALWWLQWYTRGVPRRINLACERAVLLAFALSTRRVTASMVRQACREFAGAWK